MFITFNGMATKLAEPMRLDDTGFALVNTSYERQLIAGLGDTGHTAFSIDDGTRREIVGVTSDGSQLILERGIDGTQAVAHPCGAFVAFAWTKAGLLDCVGDAVFQTDPPDPDDLEFPPCESDCDDVITIETATHRYHLNNERCLVAEPKEQEDVVRDGEYCMGNGGSITVRRGMIVAIQEADCVISTCDERIPDCEQIILDDDDPNLACAVCPDDEP